MYMVAFSIYIRVQYIHTVYLQYIYNIIFSCCYFVAYFLRTVACHVTRVSLSGTALCCDVHVTIKHFDFDFTEMVGALNPRL